MDERGFSTADCNMSIFTLCYCAVAYEHNGDFISVRDAVRILRGIGGQTEQLHSHVHAYKCAVYLQQTLKWLFIC